MAWLRRTLDHLFTEPREATPPTPISAAASAREREAERRKRLEIEIEARRGVVGF
jgi:hypothetical protein